MPDSSSSTPNQQANISIFFQYFSSTRLYFASAGIWLLSRLGSTKITGLGSLLEIYITDTDRHPLSISTVEMLRFNFTSAIKVARKITQSARATSIKQPCVNRFNTIRTYAMSSLPTENKGIFITETGGPEVLKYGSIAVPKVGPKGVVVKNSYSGVNFIEAYFRKGLYPAKYPLTLGRESAGEVVAVGDEVTKFKVGDRVGYLNPGGFAEYTAVEETATIVKLPEDVSDRQWAISALQLMTAETLVREAHPLKEGEIVLVHAAAGGVGGLLIQLAKRIGAKVIASTSSEEKAAVAKELGADYVINYKKDDIATKVKEFTNGAGVNASYDSVGAATFQASIDSLARKGTYVTYGNASGPVPPINALTLSSKGIKVVRPTLFVYLSGPGEWGFYTSQLFKDIESGIKLRVHKEYPIQDYAEATKELESGKTLGKLILKI